LKIKNPDLAAMRKLGFVKDIKTKNEFVSLTVVAASENLPEILATIGKVESVEVRSPTLNDVFLRYTGKEIRGESAEGGWMERIINYRSKK